MAPNPELIKTVDAADSVLLLTYIEYPQAYTPTAVSYAQQVIQKRGGISVVTREARSKAKLDFIEAQKAADGHRKFALPETAHPEVKRRIAEIADNVAVTLNTLTAVTGVEIEDDHKEDSTPPEMFDSIRYTLFATAQKNIGAKLELYWYRSMSMLIQLESSSYCRSDAFFRRHPRLNTGICALGILSASTVAYLLGFPPSSYNDGVALVLQLIIMFGGGVLTLTAIELIDKLLSGNQARKESRAFMETVRDTAAKAILAKLESCQDAKNHSAQLQSNEGATQDHP